MISLCAEGRMGSCEPQPPTVTTAAAAPATATAVAASFCAYVSGKLQGQLLQHHLQSPGSTGLLLVGGLLLPSNICKS